MQLSNKEQLTDKLCFIGITIFILSYFLLTSAKDQVFYVFALISLILVIYTKQQKTIPVDSPFLLSFIFLSFFSLSTLWSSEPGADLIKSLRHTSYVLIGYIVFYWALNREIQKKLPLLFSLMIISAVISVILTCVITPSQFTNSDRLVHMSLLGLTGNPIHTGVYFGTASLAAFFFYRKISSNSLSLVYLFVCLLLLLFVFLTKSRGASLFYFIGLAIIVFGSKPYTVKRDYIFVSILLAGGILAYFLFVHTIVQRMEEPNYRMQLLVASWDVIRHHIWFGTGLNHNDFLTLPTGETFTKVHNSFVQSLQVGGIFGFLITVALVLVVLHRGWKAQNDYLKLTLAWFVYGCFVLAIDGDILVDRPSREWFCFWIPLFIIASYRKKQTEYHE